MTGLEWVLAALGIVIVLGICGIVAVVLIIRSLYRRIRRSPALGGAVLRTRAGLSRGPQRKVLGAARAARGTLDSGQAAVDIAGSKRVAPRRAAAAVPSHREVGVVLDSQLQLMESETESAVLAEELPRARAWTRSPRWCVACARPSRQDSRAPRTTPSPRCAPTWTARSPRCRRACRNSTRSTNATARGTDSAATTDRCSSFEIKGNSHEEQHPADADDLPEQDLPRPRQDGGPARDARRQLRPAGEAAAAGPAGARRGRYGEEADRAAGSGDGSPLPPPRRPGPGGAEPGA